MSRYTNSQGWKIFGIVSLIVLVAIALFFAIAGIVSLVDDVAYVDLLRDFLHISKKVVEDTATNGGETTEEVVQTAMKLI